MQLTTHKTLFEFGKLAVLEFCIIGLLAPWFSTVYFVVSPVEAALRVGLVVVLSGWFFYKLRALLK